MCSRWLSFVAFTVLLLAAAGCTQASRPANPTPTNQVDMPSPSKAGGVHPMPPEHRHEDRRPAGATAPDDEAELTASLKRLRSGRLAYNPPSTMKMHQSLTITARIGGEQVSTGTLTQGLGEAGQGVQIAPTQISTQMKMVLTSNDFVIKQLSSDEQFVDETNPTEWSWQIEPKHPGKLSLHLAAIVEVGTLQKDYAAVNRQIDVKVNPAGSFVQFFDDNWQKALYAILAALLAYAWQSFLKRKNNGTPPAAPSQP